ncbi:MAG TPA: hydantoinase/oxoprolinase family protein [Saprospiraceae bacterium]|nr:hydantoinase/oxoprolinase family protein [Saprospiraceae bacterium]HMP22904.1 hydantoinase/oxoprolinase family protein [Saprospiraceae bacterium]
MKLGIDIGGTFTDLVLLEAQTGKATFAKTLTTYPDPTEGILNGVRDILQKTNSQPSEIETIVHGTTLVTNAVIERKGAKTGLITTAGFEDVLEIGRELRYDIYDIFLEMPKPLVPRHLRVGVAERLDRQGNVQTAIQHESLDIAIKNLVNEGVASVAVCLLHAFANPVHEQAIGRYLQQHYPKLYFSLSSEVMPEIREYERSSATAMNAYVQPTTDHYLQTLESKLCELGIHCVFHIMISSGRLTTIAGARKVPIQLLESGPAGGAMASVFFGKLTNTPDLLAFDMGGTTAKACIINHFQPEITNQFEAARVRRFKKGSGLPVRIPVIDLIEIGAGGGSIARVNQLGLLTVGPDSAASQPGPAAYHRGGELPTVTDADLVLGYLNENYFLGGTMQLRRDLAQEAIRQHLAKPLGISVAAAAMGVHRIVNENMANAARVHILERGLDPRRYHMIAFGGAGPVHAFNVARLLRVSRFIIPVGAGVTSALGFLVSPVASEHMVSHVSALNAMDWDKINALLSDMERKGLDFLAHAGIDLATATTTRTVDMRYIGQGHEISVRFPNGVLDASSIQDIQKAFDAEYTLRYGRTTPNIAMETVTWRVVVSAPLPGIELHQNIQNPGNQALKGQRPVYFPGREAPHETPVYDRYLLPVGTKMEGPAIIEEMESTTVVGFDSRITVDDYKNLLVDLLYE